ncbi:MAG TPA: DUF1800 domain-containing protein [Aquabacterium sp.]|nr:DUF1800 domain-containing protein [Aquabacterium sp.]
MSRRSTLKSLGLCSLTLSPLSLTLNACASSAANGSPVTPSLDDYNLLNRLSWGANDVDLDRLHRQGRAGWLQAQLEAAGHDAMPPDIQTRIDAMTISQRSLVDLAQEFQEKHARIEGLPTEDERKEAMKAQQEELNRLAREAASRHLLRAVYSPDQLRERMTWFWFNHFNVFQHKHQIRAMLGDYEEHAIRPHALGSFRTMLGAVIHHPAMLVYLDNQQNAAGKINENLARELMELHTLGVNAGYSQKDVQELARILTGHGIHLPSAPPRLNRKWADLYVQDGLYEFHPGRHDFGDKHLLGQTIKGSGANELDQALDILTRHPATGRFLSRKLAMFFCQDHPSEELISAMADTFRRTDGHIGQTLETLVRHPEFAQTTGEHFKSPVHYVVSAVRAAYNDQGIRNTRPMENWIMRLGQGLYNRQTPDGYSLTADGWSSSGQMSTRFEIARVIGNGSAGLFRAEGEAPMAERPAFPQLARAAYYQYVQPKLSADTRKALDQAGSPQEWNMLYLASPDFMYC